MENTAKFLYMIVAILLVLFCELGTSQSPELDYTIKEEMPAGTFIGNIPENAELERMYAPEDYDKLEYQFLTEPKLDLTLDKKTGVLRTGSIIDRDVKCPNLEVCRIEIQVAVQPLDYFKIIKVIIDIEDINDNIPEFPEASITHTILESANPGTTFVIPTAVDPDGGTLGVLRYELRSSSPKFRLEVENKVDGSTDVQIVLVEKLDREEEEFYMFKIVAYDGGNPPKSGSVEINVLVQDANDNQPIFEKSSYEVNIQENIAVLSTILTVRASDEDTGTNGEIRYSFSPRTSSKYGDLFGIRNTTGDIYTKKEIDYEEGHIYHLSVQAQDKGADSLPADATVIVKVMDQNDHAPKVTISTLGGSGASESGDIYIKIPEDSHIETFLAHVTVSDPDSGDYGVVVCSLNDNHFKLQQLYQTEFQIVTAALLDREAISDYSLSLTCKDNGDDPRMTIKRLHIQVLDVNDHAPIFTDPVYTAIITENRFKNTFVIHVNATDKDGGANGEVRYSLAQHVDDMFEIDPNTGVITSKVIFDHELAKAIDFEVYASDRGSPPQTGTAVIEVRIKDVNDERPRFSHPNYSFGVTENSPGGTEVGMVAAVDPDSAPYDEFEYSLVPSDFDSLVFIVDSQTGKISTLEKLDREMQSVYYLIIAATDSAIPTLSSTASVSIYIADENDNAPVFEFPKKQNNTVHISNQVPVGYIASKLKASDADVGINAQIRYYMAEGNDPSPFAVDEVTGAVMVMKNVNNIQSKSYTIQVKAEDQGEDRRSTMAHLNIVVNDSIAYASSKAPLLGGHNFTIVISMACVSGVIAVVLIIAIVVIYRHWNQEEKRRKYNCRMEALKILTAKENGNKDSDDGDIPETTKDVGGMDNSATSNEAPKSKKEVSFSLDMDDSYIQRVPEHGLANNRSASTDHLHDGNNHNHTSPQSYKTNTLPLRSMNASSYQNSLRPSSNTALSSRHPYAHGHMDPWQPRDPEGNKVSGLGRRDPDSDSAYSGDGSNTDSGRGPSEEGELGAHFHNTSHSPGSQVSQGIRPRPQIQRPHVSVPGLQSRAHSYNHPKNHIPLHPISSSMRGSFNNNEHRDFARPLRQNLPSTGVSAHTLYEYNRPLTIVTGKGMPSQYGSIANGHPSSTSYQGPRDGPRKAVGLNDSFTNISDVSSTSGSYIIDPQDFQKAMDSIHSRDVEV